MKYIQKPIIGVLGGMGSQASVEFYRLFIEKSSTDYGAINNDDFPEILIDSIPVPDFVSNTKNMGQAASMLLRQLLKLTKRYITPRVDGIVLGCTELPVVFLRQYKVPVFNSLTILTVSILKHNYRKEFNYVRT